MRILAVQLKRALFGLAVIGLAGCGTTPPSSGSGTAVSELKREAGEYRLEPGDELSIFVLNEPDLTNEYPIDGSGIVSLPLIGDVYARGKTLREFDTLVTAKLADGYLRSPDVTVELLNYPPYYILGEVNEPGQYDYEEDLTVLKAVAAAGGFSYRANQKVIMIQGADDPDETRVALEPGTKVLPGDTIRVLERFF